MSILTQSLCFIEPLFDMTVDVENESHIRIGWICFQPITSDDVSVEVVDRVLQI